MGACDFESRSMGKTAQEAFSLAKAEAHYEHGHGGYSGTIAEKNSFEVINCPSGLTVHEFTRLMVEAYAYEPYGSKDVSEMPCTPEHREVVMRAAKVFDDKWGPAVCIPLEEGEGVNNRFLFCGMASS